LPSPKLEGVVAVEVFGESGGVGCSSGLIDRSVTGSLRSRLNGIATCCGDSCCFPVIGKGCELAQEGGPSLLINGSSSMRGCLGSGVIRMGETRGNCDDDATGGDGFGEFPGNGGMSHGRGIRSSEDGVVSFLTGGNGISSGIGDLFHGVGMIGVASLRGGDGVSDWGNGILMGSLTIMGVGSYCSINEYCHQCDPQGTKGSGGVSMWGGDLMTGGLG